MKHPPTHRGCQTFRFLNRAWCVSQALALIQADPTAAEFIEAADITALDGYVELTPTTPGRMRLFVVEVDTEYALTRTNLDTPLIWHDEQHSGKELASLLWNARQ